MKATYKILKTDHFMRWFEKQSERTQLKVQNRLDIIETYMYFGVTNFFDGIIELKWKSGLRLYTARIDHSTIVVLAGGTKHGQNKEIRRAKKILKAIKKDYSSSS